MNLEFVDIKSVERDGSNFILQRADVTHDRIFWRNWRTCSDALKKLIYLSRDGGRWFAFRLKPVEEGNGYGAFECSYTLKHTEGLLPYQPKAVSALTQAIIRYGAAADGSDTGIGKTFHALAVCRELGLKPAIICRKAGISGWRRACGIMGIQPAFIVNWESARTAKYPWLSRTQRQYSRGYDYIWKMAPGALLIFDEAHLGFNDDSQNYALWTASKGLASLSLSATFADRPSRLKGLFNVLNIMDPKQFDEWLFQRGQFYNSYSAIEGLTDLEDMKNINKQLYPKHGYRISYDDPEVKKVFPDAMVQTEIVDLGKSVTLEQNEAYKELLTKALEYKTLGKQAQFLVADTRYRQHAELLKVQWLVEMTKEYIGEGLAVCIFVNFLDTLKYLAKALNTKSLIFGSQERYGLARETVIDNFQKGKERIILCMVEAGGQSINLHDVNGLARRVSLVCPTYNPISLQQVMGRTRRAGSKTSPLIKLVYAAGTVEEKVAERVNNKLDNIAALNDGDLMEPDLFNMRG